MKIKAENSAVEEIERTRKNKRHLEMCWYASVRVLWKFKNWRMAKAFTGQLRRWRNHIEKNECKNENVEKAKKEEIDTTKITWEDIERHIRKWKKEKVQRGLVSKTKHRCMWQKRYRRDWGKRLSAMVTEKRLENKMNDVEMRPDGQSGFRKKRRTIDNVYIYTESAPFKKKIRIKRGNYTHCLCTLKLCWMENVFKGIWGKK